MKMVDKDLKIDLENKRLLFEYDFGEGLKIKGLSISFNFDNISVNFIDYLNQYLEKYDKKDKRVMCLAINRFKQFIGNCEYLESQAITLPFLQKFATFLNDNGKGEGPYSTWKRFRRILKKATDDHIFLTNPAIGVKFQPPHDVLKKAVLTAEEFSQLISTPYHISPDLKKAIIFSYYTGLRWCDVHRLTYQNIDFVTKRLTITQAKTDCIITNPLCDELIALIGPPDIPSRKLFNLPSYMTANRMLKQWVSASGIQKHITWHCLRHSVATELLRNGENIKLVADFLGHSNLKTVGRYVRALDEDKKRALQKLPSLKPIISSPTGNPQSELV